MAVGSSFRRTGPTVGDGATLVFSYNFWIVDETHLNVYEITTATGAIIKKVLASDYTVQSINNQAGGSITFTSTHGAPAATKEILILGTEPTTSESQLAVGGQISLAAIDAGLDRITRIVQQHDEKIARMTLWDKFFDGFNLDIPFPAIASGDVAKFLSISADLTPYGLAWVTAVPTGSVTFSAFGETLVDDANATAAQTTLGVLIGTDVIAKSVHDAHVADAGKHQEMKLLPEVVSKVNDTTEADTAWATVDISADTGADTATIAMLHCEFSIREGATILGAGDLALRLRKTGTTPTAPDEMRYVYSASTTVNPSLTVTRTMFVELDSSEQFDWQVIETTNGIDDYRTRIKLFGYIIG